MRRRRVSFVVLVAMCALLAPEARGQSYGPEEQVLTIGAGEFQAFSAFETYIDDHGYAYFQGEHRHFAPLRLPEGAAIERLCLFVNDSDSSHFGYVAVFLLAVKLASGGESTTVAAVGEGAYSSADVGYGYYCSDPFSYTLRGRTDIDMDGGLDTVAYYVFADVPAAEQNALGLGGVQLFWKRSVSDPPLTPTFGDVPSTDTAFPHIEALVASGITAGCGGGNYCPDSRLSRQQMAVFVAKALGLHWAD